MQVSVETLEGLERKLTISVPSEKVEEEVGQRLKQLAKTVKMDGFRPGKVPFNMVVTRFGENVRQDVARELVQSTLYDALKEKELIPAGSPYIEPQQVEKGKNFQYTATFEVYPSFEINQLAKDEVEIITATVSDEDVENMLNKLREQNKNWKAVERNVAKGDKVILDFNGFIDGQEIKGGSAKNHELIIGSGAFIPGFEDQLIGAPLNTDFEINVTFPETYGEKDLAGKKALFKVNVRKVLEGELPDLNDAFAEKFNIKDGLSALKKDIRQNMERELERRIKVQNREKIFAKLLEKNTFDIPKTLIEREIEHLKHEMYHQIFGHEHKNDEKIPDFPRSLFEEKAINRVKLGILFSEYVKKHEISVNIDDVNAMIEKLASAYDNPEEVKNWYRASKERLAEVEALVLEDLVSQHVLKDATIINKTVSYDEIMNPTQA